ncbi:MAG: sulfatase [Halobacteriales archaeon]
MKPNVCIIVLDAVRASNLSGYGHDRETTPNIDAVMDESVVFTRACSPTGVTIDSTASLLSGQYPIEHQSGKARRMNADSPLLQESLRDAGYRTGAVTCNPFLSPAFGFDVGFDEMHPVTQQVADGMNMRKFYDETNDLPAWRRYLEFATRSADRNVVSNLKNALQFKFGLFEGDDDGGERATRWAENFVTASAADPFFLYAHYTETHMNSTGTLPYAVPDEEAMHFLDGDEELSGIHTRSREVDYGPEKRDIHERLYDGAIRYLDRKVGRLVETLREADEWDETLFVVTADHGELLGEHGLLGHSYLYEPGVNVPLVVKLPASDDRRGRKTDDRIGTIGLYRTLAEYVGVSPPDDVRGGNLLADRPEIVLVQDYSNSWDWSRYEDDEADDTNCIYRDEKKLIVGGSRSALFDLDEDPDERRDLSEERPELVADLESDLSSTLDALRSEDVDAGEPLDVDDETRSRLADLGYL